MNASAAEILDAGRQQADLSVPELWIRCCAIGGAFSPNDLQQVLGGEVQPRLVDYDVIAQALNDTFVERGGDHPVPYAEDIGLTEADRR